jgi:hypothetical protein
VGLYLSASGTCFNWGTRHAERLCGTCLRDQALIEEVYQLASQSDDSAAEATAHLAALLQHERRQVRVDAGRLWALMLCNCSDVFFRAATTEAFLVILTSLLEGKLTRWQKLLLVEGIEKVIKSRSVEETPSSLQSIWKSIQPKDEVSPQNP